MPPPLKTPPPAPGLPPPADPAPEVRAAPARPNPNSSSKLFASRHSGRSTSLYIFQPTQLRPQGICFSNYKRGTRQQPFTDLPSAQPVVSHLGVKHAATFAVLCEQALSAQVRQGCLGRVAVRFGGRDDPRHGDANLIP